MITKDPTDEPDAGLLYRQGIAAYERGDPDEAVTLLEASVKLDAQSETHESLGRIYADVGNFEEAERHLRRAARLDPREPRTSYELARVYVALERRADAIVLLESIIDKAPGFEPAHELFESLTGADESPPDDDPRRR